MQNKELFLKEFGKQLKRIRTQQDLTQCELAAKAGLSESQVQRIEYGNHNFTIFTLLALEDALGLMPGQLLYNQP